MLLFFVKSNFCDILPYLCINQHHCLNEFLHPKNNAFKEVFWSIGITENYDTENYIIFPLLLLLADVIASQGVATIIAVDVGSEDNNDLTNYGDHISGWYLLWNKINPFAKKIRVRMLD